LLTDYLSTWIKFLSQKVLVAELIKKKPMSQKNQSRYYHSYNKYALSPVDFQLQDFNLRLFDDVAGTAG
jgi:hypothetical protein